MLSSEALFVLAKGEVSSRNVMKDRIWDHGSEGSFACVISDLDYSALSGRRSEDGRLLSSGIAC